MHLSEWQRQFNLQLAQNIVIARQVAGLTQKQLAVRLGMVAPVLSRLEGGAQRITAVQLAVIATALDLQPMSLWPKY